MEFELLAKLVVVSGISVSLVQEILKLRIIPLVFANRYPVPTNIVLSVIASVIALYTQGLLEVSSWLTIGTTVMATAVIASMTYNNLLDNWKQLKTLEGEK